MKVQTGRRKRPATLLTGGVVLAVTFLGVRPADAQAGSETVLLADDFNGPAIDSAKWKIAVLSGYQDATIPVVQRNNRLEIGPLKQNAIDSSYNALLSVNTYNLTGAYAWMQSVQAPPSTTAAALMLTLALDNANHYRISADNGLLRFEKKLAATKSVIASVTFSATTHAFWRIRHDPAADQIVFETAPNSGGVPGTWSTRATVPRQLSIAALRVEVKGGTYQPESSAPGILAADRVRVARPLPETVLLADTFTGATFASAKWTFGVLSGYQDSSVPLIQQNNRIEIGPLRQNATDSSYNALLSTNTIDLTAAYASVHAVQAPPSSTLAALMFTVPWNNTNHYRISVDSGVMRFEKKVSGTKTSIASLTYSRTTHAFWRIRHDVGTDHIIFETAANIAGGPGVWTTRASVVRELTITALKVELKGGTFQPEATSPGIVAFDDVRVARSAAPAGCAYTVSPANVGAASGGAVGSVAVSAAMGCSWVAASNVPWITASSSGTGNGTVPYSISANTTSSSRTGTITIAGQVFTVTQAAASPTCSYAVSPTSESVGSGNQSGALTVTTGSGCGWTAQANSTFLHIQSGGAGVGPGTVSYSVANNTSTSNRSGTLTVAGVTVPITQAGMSPPPTCTYSVSPTNETVGPENQSRSLTVTTTADCPWTAQSLANFMQVTTGSSGTGPGTVTYFVENNTAPESRTGTLDVAGRTITVAQQGVAPSSGVTGSLNPLEDSSPVAGGDLTDNPFCISQTWVNDPSMLVFASANLSHDGRHVAQQTVWGLGTAYAYVSGPVTIGRRDTDLVCDVNSSFGGETLRYTYPARTPINVNSSLDMFEFFAVGDYERLRNYVVTDNYGTRYGYTDTIVDESYTIADNGCNIIIAENDGMLNADGEFADRYRTTPRIAMCDVDPSCVTRTTQTYTIASRIFSHSVNWSCTNVEVGR